MTGIDGIMAVLPDSVRKALGRGGVHIEDYEELRMRSGCPFIMKKKGRFYCLGVNGQVSELTPTAFASGGIYGNAREMAVVTGASDIERMLFAASRFSVYAAQEQIKEGYLTLQGGHRLGLAGEVVERDGKIEGMSHIQSCNIRIAREVRGCAQGVYKWLWDGGEFMNTLIVSAPGCGKTTLLRDLVRLLSDGTPEHGPLTVGLSDERSEIASCIAGVPQNDVGINTDVMDKGAKSITMRMLLRTMSPQVLAADEAGNNEDAQVFSAAKGWGVKLLATLHTGRHAEAVRDMGLEGVFSRRIEILGGENRQYRIFDENRKCLAVVSPGPSPPH